MIVTDIVIIDSGVRCDHPFLEGRLIKGIHFTEVNNQYEMDEDIEDKIGHGTAIYQIIYSHNDKVKIFPIKIIDNEVSEKVLIEALEYIFTNIECKIINLSLGLCTMNNKQRLYAICKKLADKGVLIISAFDNNGAVSFPAAFDNVIGVISGEACMKTTDYEFVENSMVNLIAKGGLQRVAWNGPMVSVQEGNSFACAHITGIISQVWKVTIDNYFELIDYLRIHANKCYISPEKNVISPSPRIGTRACILPFNKEIHSLIRFEHLLPFTVSGIYDLKYSAKIGASTNDLLNSHNSTTHIIKNIDTINYEDFDTLILGHIDYYLQLDKQKSQIVNIIRKCLEMNKYIYSFDDIEKLIDDDIKNFNLDRVFYPSLDKDMISINPFGMLFRQKSPILSIAGTSSKQGKFTLQLILRENFIKAGYNIGQLGTEPSSYLFGMDECFHFGYNAGLDFKPKEVVTHINNLLYRITEKEPDLILVGSQSGSIPWEFGNINGYTLQQLQFLLATNPDAVILCINEYDTFNVIGRTITFIESAVDCNVIAIVVFPMTLNMNEGQYSGALEVTDDRFKELENNIKKTFKKDLYLLGKDTHMDRLFNTIIEHFSYQD